MGLGSVTVDIDFDGQLSSIARRTGYSKSYISRIFSCDRRPSLECASRIAEAIHITVDQFYTWWKERKRVKDGDNSRNVPNI